MKYKAIEIDDGKWAVGAGKNRYFTKTVGTKKYAEEQALLMSAQWYFDQAEKAWQKLLDSTPQDDYFETITLDDGSELSTSMFDSMC